MRAALAILGNCPVERRRNTLWKPKRLRRMAYKLGTLEAVVVALKDQVGSLHVDIARAQQ